MPPTRPEILAPAGDPAALWAAIRSGADAVYLGMARFNARGRAERFRGVAFQSCARAAHENGVKVYVTLNTLLHDDELPLALDLAAEAREGGADAVIVQDLGLASVLRERFPDLPIHGSTQMSIHQPDQAEEAVRLVELRRIIVARECSLEEVARIAERIEPMGADVEVFVHGALCFSYSGQCLMSNFAGRRSANRGICAQNCRFDFTAGQAVRRTGDEAGRAGFVSLPIFEPRKATQLISMKDLAAFESVASLASAGVASFKIEGRLKGPDYVAEVTRLYRSAVDAWERGEPFQAEEAERAAGRVYSRGFTNGYLSSRIDPSMRGDKRSLEGEPDVIVRAANRKSGLLLLEPRPGHSVRAGQGYRYAHDRYRGGFRVTGARRGKKGQILVRVRFGAEASGRRHRRGAAGRRRPPPPLPLGLPCYLNDDPELARRIEELIKAVKVSTGPAPVPLHFDLEGAAGEPLRVRASAPDGRTAHAASAQPLERARTRSLDEGFLREHLGRLGATPFRLASLDASRLSPGMFLPFPALHSLRRDLVRALGDGRSGAMKESRPRHFFALPETLEPNCTTGLSVSVGSPSAALGALQSGADSLVIEDGRLLAGDRERETAWRPVLEALKEPWFRFPPIVHDHRGDRRAMERLRELFPSARILAGHLGQMALARELGLPASADLYLNCYNHSTVEVLRAAGARRVTMSLEVDAREAARVRARSRPGIEIEVVVGGAVFSMLTRQDFGLDEGEELGSVSEHGHAYRFAGSAQGITTLYEARELVGAQALPFLAGRVEWVRLDLAHQGARAVREISTAYKAALTALRESHSSAEEGDRIAAAEEAHRRHSPAGTFSGHLVRGARALDGGVS